MFSAQPVNPYRTITFQAFIFCPVPMPQKNSQFETKGKNIQNGPFGTSLHECSIYLKLCKVPHKIPTVIEINLKTLPPPNS